MTFSELYTLLRDFSFTTDPQTAADLGYVHPGSDQRLAGELGRILGTIQTASAFKDSTPPDKVLHRLPGDVFLEVATHPDRPEVVLYSVAKARPDGRWFTLRMGYKYDAHWGDHGTVGHNPDPDIIGGYFLDVVPKLNADKPFIEGVE